MVSVVVVSSTAVARHRKQQRDVAVLPAVQATTIALLPIDFLTRFSPVRAEGDYGQYARVTSRAHHPPFTMKIPHDQLKRMGIKAYRHTAR